MPSGGLLLAAGLALLALAMACNQGGPGDASPGPELTAVTSPSPEAEPGLLDRCEGDLAANAPALTVFGAEAGDFLADRFSLASGDFNGDGRDDLLIGAPLADGPDNSRENAGEAYVILGAASPPAVIDLALGEAALTIYGEAGGHNLGFTVASGDLNGDGTDDALVGARFAGTDSKGVTGKAYVIFGSPELGPAVDTARGEQDVTLVGIDGSDLLGTALASGDIDGDGVGDIIVGASGGRGPADDRQSAGEVYVVTGSPQLRGLIDLAEQPPYFTVYGAAAEDNLPNYLASGDVDSDGRDEILLGAPFAEGGEDQVNAGRAYVVPVPEGGGSLDLAEGKGFTTLIGAATRDGLGFYVASGDVNDDGKDDVIIGARDADGRDDATNNSGEVHILFGTKDLPRSIDLAQDQADAVIYGSDAGDSLGFSVAIADVNGDGIADILAGAPIGDSCENARQDGGEAYVILGRRDFPAETSVTHGADLAFAGMEAGDELGFSLAAGDFNGDGITDVMLGALLANGPDNTREGGGEAYVVLSERR